VSGSKQTKRGMPRPNAPRSAADGIACPPDNIYKEVIYKVKEVLKMIRII
jgi:hypothetical protein